MKRPGYAGCTQGYGQPGGRVKLGRAPGAPVACGEVVGGHQMPRAGPIGFARIALETTRRQRSLPRSRSCGKSRKVVSVPGALGITEFPGATIRAAFATAWAAAVPQLSTPVDNSCGRRTGAAQGRGTPSGFRGNGKPTDAGLAGGRDGPRANTQPATASLVVTHPAGRTAGQYRPAGRADRIRQGRHRTQPARSDHQGVVRAAGDADQPRGHGQRGRRDGADAAGCRSAATGSIRRRYQLRHQRGHCPDPFGQRRTPGGHRADRPGAQTSGRPAPGKTTIRMGWTSRTRKPTRWPPSRRSGRPIPVAATTLRRTPRRPG